jgi:hypothetical protein
MTSLQSSVLSKMPTWNAFNCGGTPVIQSLPNMQIMNWLKTGVLYSGQKGLTE